MSDLKEFEEAARGWFKEYDIDCSLMTPSEVVEAYLNIENRLITQQPREVFFSGTISGKRYSSEIKDCLDMIVQKIRAGDNLNGHLTRKLLSPRFTDKLFSDWGIQHLHLSPNPHKKIRYLFEGTEHVLFAMFTENSSFLIDIGTHTDEANSNYPFAERRLLQIVADQWPALLEPYRIPWAVDLEVDVTDPKVVHTLRLRGISVPHKINGSCYLPAGGGITTAATSVMVRRQMNELHHAQYVGRDTKP